ncbi:hypothetical protein N0V88_008068 [Collariella sp. IMI 366227]|nr:hypothetical protein N0V88_008068 [Collariella sp. IMI 366227]
MGEGVLRSPNKEMLQVAGSRDVKLESFKTLFFDKTAQGINAADQWWARIDERSPQTPGEEPATFVTQGYADGAKGLKAQANQLRTWMTDDGSVPEVSYGRLTGLEIPVLVPNGYNQDDYMVPTANSLTLQQKLPNAELVIYPNSSPGGIFHSMRAVFHAMLFCF